MKGSIPPGASVGACADAPSRSRKKRESLALQKHGEELAALSPAVWETLRLPPVLREALYAFKTLRSREAIRRHLQYIGRLMRELDSDERDDLLSVLSETQTASVADAAARHRIASLRESLLSPDKEFREKAFADILRRMPTVEEPRLRNLVEGSLAERAKQRPPKHARALFRYLRDAE